MSRNEFSYFYTVHTKNYIFQGSSKSYVTGQRDRRFWMILGPPSGKRDGVIEHTSKRENVNWIRKIALLRDKSIWHLGVNMNFG